MVENSTSGLAWLAPDNTVVVTREEFHQSALQRYAPRADGKPRKVGVELRIAPISHGSHAGEPGIEVWLDGRQVGELTALMSRRYGSVVTEVLRRGGRPGAEARVINGPRGVEVEIRLPDPPTGAPSAPPVIPPAARPAAPRPARRRAGKPLLIGAGVVVGLLVIGGITNGRNGEVPTTPSATTTSATSAAAAPPTIAPATSAPPAAAAPLPASLPPVAAAPVPASPVPARVITSAPRPVPPPAQPPAPKPQPATAVQPASSCDPNYSGCVPVATDVDCEGGSGNGPAYVRGPVRVTGTDIYDLDRDKDRIACE